MHVHLKYEGIYFISEEGEAILAYTGSVEVGTGEVLSISRNNKRDVNKAGSGGTVKVSE